MLEAWEALLPVDDPERRTILQGIKDGFRITTKPYDGPQVFQSNYSSATSDDNREAVESQIKEELSNGRYKLSANCPRIISALGAIRKEETGKIRLIHDCSRPLGGAVNDFADGERFSYQTIQDACELIKPGAYLGKIDLSSAYRSVKIHPDDHVLTGLSWTFQGDKGPTVMCDSRLPFGSKLSPQHFNSLTQAVRRIMASRGHQGVVAYLDDFLCIGQTRERCQQVMDELRTVLRLLGFAINYNKLEGPATRLVFLGVQICTEDYTLALAPTRVRALEDELHRAAHCRSLSKRELQSVVGRLNWAAQVVFGGRPYLRRLIDRINVLKRPLHRTRITGDMRADLEWWIKFLSVFNGSAPILDQRPLTPVCIDASEKGGGGYHGGEWFNVAWEDWPGTTTLPINYKETLALWPAVCLWGHLWKDKKVVVHSDNQAAVAIINRGTAKDPNVMEVLRHVWWASATFNFRLKAVYYPGRYNTLADAASRLREPGGGSRLFNLLHSTLLF